jgi:hypothetical protein
MKNSSIIFVAALMAASNVSGESTIEDIIRTGPRAGQTVRVVKTERSPKEATVVRPESTVAIVLRDGQNSVPVELLVLRHEGVRISGTNLQPFTCYEFQVRAQEPVFVWSCWTPSFPRPHRFQVLNTESGKTYACYVRAGVHLFRLAEGREPDSIRREFWESPEKDLRHRDALPLLPISEVQDALSRTNTLGLGPQTWNITVDGISESAGELRVVVHGMAAKPRCTFALRGDKWELVSRSGN